MLAVASITHYKGGLLKVHHAIRVKFELYFQSINHDREMIQTLFYFAFTPTAITEKGIQ